MRISKTLRDRAVAELTKKEFAAIAGIEPMIASGTLATDWVHGIARSKYLLLLKLLRFHSRGHQHIARTAGIESTALQSVWRTNHEARTQEQLIRLAESYGLESDTAQELAFVISTGA